MTLKERVRPWLLVAPALAAYAVFLAGPIIGMFQTSFETADGSFPTLENYARFFGDTFYLEVLWRTVRIALVCTIILLLAGYPAALYLYLGGRGRRIVVLILLSPLFVSAVVRTYGWILVFVPNSGLLATIPGIRGIPLYHTEIAITIGLVHVLLPFMVLAIYANMSQLKHSLLLAAAGLGANPLRIGWDIVLPLTRTGAIAGAALTFALAATSVSTPILLGGASEKTMAYLIYQSDLVLFEQEFGAAQSVILFVAVLLVLSLTGAFGRQRHLAAVG